MCFFQYNYFNQVHHLFISFLPCLPFFLFYFMDFVSCLWYLILVSSESIGFVLVVILIVVVIGFADPCCFVDLDWRVNEALKSESLFKSLAFSIACPLPSALFSHTLFHLGLTVISFFSYCLIIFCKPTPTPFFSSSTKKCWTTWDNVG